MTTFINELCPAMKTMWRSKVGRRYSLKRKSRVSPNEFNFVLSEVIRKQLSVKLCNHLEWKTGTFFANLCGLTTEYILRRRGHAVVDKDVRMRIFVFGNRKEVTAFKDRNRKK